MLAVVGEHGVDRVGHGFDEGAQEVTGDTPCGFLVQVEEGELADPVDGDQQIQPTLSGLDLSDVDVEVAERVGLKLALAWSGALDLVSTPVEI